MQNVLDSHSCRAVRISDTERLVDDIGEQTTPLDYYKQQLGGNGDVQVF